MKLAELLQDLFNTILGAHSFKNTTGTRDYNTGVGYEVGMKTIGNVNTYHGYRAGYNITSADNNVSIGPQTGPTSTSQAEVDGQLYIDTSNHNTFRGVDSLIYGDQSSTSAQTLSFNAAVTISKEDSDGTLRSKVVKLKFGLVV